MTGQSAPPLHVLYAECGTHLKRLAQAATHFAAGELLSLAFDQRRRIQTNYHRRHKVCSKGSHSSEIINSEIAWIIEKDPLKATEKHSANRWKNTSLQRYLTPLP